MKRCEEAKHYENLAKVVETIIEENMYSDISVNCKSESEYFEESCKYVNLVYELLKLTQTWRNLAKYNKIIGNEK